MTGAQSSPGASNVTGRSRRRNEAAATRQSPFSRFRQEAPENGASVNNFNRTGIEASTSGNLDGRNLRRRGGKPTPPAPPDEDSSEAEREEDVAFEEEEIAELTENLGVGLTVRYTLERLRGGLRTVHAKYAPAVLEWAIEAALLGKDCSDLLQEWMVKVTPALKQKFGKKIFTPRKKPNESMSRSRKGR
jgi:hypothetical protein